ncbi:MAG: AsmA family protein [Gammaproteobacteria bacterium]|nr:MAG: AsmA family protein [Gammaproteobacteria bacterium]
MNKKLKLILLIAVIAVVSFVGLLVVGYMMLDPNDFKQEISDIVKKKTGQELVISGDIEKSIYPNLGVNIGAVALKNPQGYEAEDFAKLDKMSVSISLMPLFSGKIVADTVLLHGAMINLEKDVKGKANWEVFAGAAAKDKPDEQEKKPAKELDAEKFQFEGVEIIDASLTFADKQSGQKVVLEKVNLITEIEELTEPFLVKFSAQMANEKPKATADFDLKALVTLSPDLKQVKLEDLVAKLNADAPEVLPTRIQAQLDTEIDLNLDQMAVAVKNLQLKLLDLLLKADINAENIAANPAFDANVELVRFNPRDLTQKLNIELPKMQGKDSLTAFELKAAIVGTMKKLELKQLNVVLDQTKIDGNAAVNNLMNPATSFAINVDKINVDNYLPPKSDKPQQQQQAQTSAKQEKMDLEPLRKLNLNGVIKVGEVVVNNLKAENIEVVVKAKDGIIQANPVNADLYQGKFDANVKLDARTDTPKIALKKNLVNFQAGPFTKDLMEKERITGNANVNIDITAKGIDPEHAKKTLNGKVSFKFLDGAVKGINVGKMIREGQAMFKGGEASEQEQTDFAEISGSAEITNGIVQNNDLKAQSPLLRVTGKGKVDLPKNQVDYVAVVALVATSKGQGGKGFSDLNKAPIPLKIKGDLASPEIGLDFDEAMKLVGEKKKEEVKEKAKKKIEEKIGNKLGGKLKGLFGR